MKISPWWEQQKYLMSRDIPSLKSPEEAIIYAQTQCKFDHRKPYDSTIIGDSLVALENDFREDSHTPLRDSKYSWKPSMGLSGYSDMFLMHLYFYLRITSLIEKPKRILEIGAGYGETARIFLSLDPEIEYTIVDLSESLFFSSSYLKLNGLKNIDYLTPDELWYLKDKEFDLVVNTLSFQEMLPKTVAEYMRFIQEDIKAKHFYSLNYCGNKRTVMGDGSEQSFDEPPPYDTHWEILHEKRNPEIMAVTSPKNYLELLLKRRP